MTSLSIDTDGRQHARANVRQFRKLQQTLDGAIFAERSVKHWKYDVDLRVSVRLRRNRSRAATCLLSK